MKNQENLRKEVKLLKATQNISFTLLAEYIEIKRNSFYNWLKGSYELSQERANWLQEVIDTLKE